MGKEKVEKFRLTPEVRDWMKQYRGLVRVKRMLEKGVLVQMGKVQHLRGLLTQVTQGMQMGLQNAPVKKVTELEGQED